MSEHKADISVDEFVAKLIGSPARPRASRAKKPRPVHVEDKQPQVSPPQKRKKSPDSEHRPKKNFKRYERSKLHVIINPSLDSEPLLPVPNNTINTRQNNENVQDDEDITILSEKDESTSQQKSKKRAQIPQSSPQPPAQETSLAQDVPEGALTPDALKSAASSKIVKSTVRTKIAAVVASTEPPVAKLSRAERHARVRQLKREKKRQRKEARRLRKREHAKAAENRKLEEETHGAKDAKRQESPPVENAHITVFATQEQSQSETTVFATQDQSQYETADEAIEAVTVSSVQYASAGVVLDSEEDVAKNGATALPAAKSKAPKASKTSRSLVPPANSDRANSASKNAGYVLFDVFTGTKPSEADAQVVPSLQSFTTPQFLFPESDLAPQPEPSHNPPLLSTSPSLEVVPIPYDSLNNRLLSKKGALILERICSMGMTPAPPNLQRRSGFDPKKKIRLVEIGRLPTVEEKRQRLAEAYLQSLDRYLKTRAERKK